MRFNDANNYNFTTKDNSKNSKKILLPNPKNLRRLFNRLVTLILLIAVYFVYAVNSKNSGSFDARIIEAIDGDTVKLDNGKLVRYIGIDTPEMRLKNNDTWDYNPQPFAQEAKEFNRKLVEGKIAHIEFDVEKNDRYGRVLGYCFVGKEHINAKLIENGFAVVYTKPPNVKYADLFLSLQRKARKEKLGLWGAYEVIEPEQAQNYINAIRAIKGEVVFIKKTPKCIFLYFTLKPNKRSFKLVIFNKALKYFYNKNIDPCKFYKNKIIEVSGRIRDYKGPEIIINSPEEIELL